MMVIIADGVIKGCAEGSIDHYGESELPGQNSFCPCSVTLLVNLSHHSGRNLETIYCFIGTAPIKRDDEDGSRDRCCSHQAGLPGDEVLGDGGRRGGGRRDPVF